MYTSLAFLRRQFDHGKIGVSPQVQYSTGADTFIYLEDLSNNTVRTQTALWLLRSKLILITVQN